jgi:hypothetical protein
MKFLCYALVLLASLGLAASDSDVAGTWKAEFTCPRDERPKVPATIVFDLKADGKKLTGMAHMAPWPGDAPLSDGTIEGDRVHFTVVGKLPSGVNGERVTGYPNMVFSGTVHGKEMTLTLQWGSILVNGEKQPGHTYPMLGKKNPD